MANANDGCELSLQEQLHKLEEVVAANGVRLANLENDVLTLLHDLFGDDEDDSDDTDVDDDAEFDPNRDASEEEPEGDD